MRPNGLTSWSPPVLHIAWCLKLLFVCAIFRMVSKYKRKSTRGSYGIDKLQRAIDEVKSGRMSKNKASAVFGVPRKTLSRHLMGRVQKPGSFGRYLPVLSAAFEEALVEHTVHLQRMLFGLSTTDIRQLAFELAERNGVKHPFHDNKAGKAWLCGFLQRHQELAIRSPEPTSLARAVGFNKPSVDKFFSLYKEELEKGSFTDDRIWNADETGLTVVHVPRKVLAKKGDKQVGHITSGQKGETVTMVGAVNAAGRYLAHMLIFKRKRMSPLLLRGTPPGSVGRCD